ncbi:MAG: hypothetical protein JNL11_13115 [Bdellovibrionaceae bacterium]|nr:hypothetical protein [Pseudobdellovibrionaceae bacterium]
MYVFVINIALVLWSLHLFGKSFSSSRWHMKPLKNQTSEFKDYLWLSLSIGFTSSSWRTDFLRQSQLWRSQIWDYRRFLFSQAQILFSFFALFMCLALFLQVSGYFLLLVAFAVMTIGQVPWVRDRVGSDGLGFFVYLGLSLFFLETCFKNSGLMMQALLDSELVFITTVDSLVHLFLLLFLSIFLGVFIPVQGWSLIVTFLLYVNSHMTFLAMVFVVVGELLGTCLYLAYRAHAWSAFYKKRIQGLFVTVAGYLIGVLMAVVIFRYFFSFGGMFNQLETLQWIHLGTMFLILAGLYTAVMTWGHFKVARQERDIVISDVTLVDELVLPKKDGKSDSKNDGQNFRRNDELTEFIISQLGQRREKLNHFKSELQLDPQSRGKIPPFVLNQFETEMNIIDKAISKT